jgi:signal transduction histidine kinase
VSVDLVENLSEHVWNMDDDAIAEHFLNYPADSLGLVSVEVQTEYGDVLFEKTYTEETSPIKRSKRVIRDGRTIGFVEVTLSVSGWIAMKRALGHAGAMIIGIATIAILLISTWIVNLVVVRPVERTVADLRKIADGDYHHTIPGAPTTELRLINQEINIMATEIAQRQHLLERSIARREHVERDLRDLTEDLEVRIKKRTIRLRRLAQMLTAAQDNEQRRIAEGLHDDVAQLLAAGRMKIALASTKAPECPCTSMMPEIDDLIEQAYERLRLLSFELASSTLYQWGLKESLDKLCAGMNERFGVCFEIVEAASFDDIDDTSATLLFKSAREILFNVIKHSGVTSATVRLEETPESFVVVIEDAGKGFSEEVDVGAGHGLGLFSIRERLEDIDGEMTIESEPGLTRVSLIVPRGVEDEGA